MDNSLIAGMPEVIAYIKKIEEENKQLKEENKQLAKEVAAQVLKVCNQSVEIADWKAKAKNKSEILMKYLPDYNPLFNPGSDTECIEASLKEIIEEKEQLNEKLSNAEYELDSLKTDLKPLDDMMYEKKICEYEDVVEHVAELETSAQSTENYWKSKYENEVDTNKMLMEAIEANSSEMERLQKYSEIMGDIDGDQLTDLLKDYGWEYNDDGELEKVTD